MWMTALRDLQWRRRRFLIAVIGTSLVFGMTLVLAGLATSFDREATRTLAVLGADGWVVHAGVAGPFSSGTPLPSDRVAQVAGTAGVRAAGPVVFARQATGGNAPLPVQVFGALPGAVAAPHVSQGRPPRRRGEAAISTKLHEQIGDRLEVGGRMFTVVGRVSGSTLYAGIPNVFVTLHDAQDLMFNGQSIVSAIAVRGTPSALPGDLAFVSGHAAHVDLLRPLKDARKALTIVAALLWIVAACIVGSVVYLSALERVRDFAVFKATGASTASLLAGLAVQAVIISMAAAVVGAVLGVLLAPRFPLPVTIPASALLLLPAISVTVGLLARLAGLRRTATVDPALAFAGP
jgi:putative ABC transport system permease protein